MSTDPKQKKEVSEALTTKNQILPDERLKELIDINLDWPGYIKPPYESGKFAERFRAIKWELLNLQEKSQNSKRLLVTSTHANEGKSAIVYNLGISLSLERDWQSVMVDTSDESDSITNKLGMGSCTGLTDYLLGQATIEQVVYRSTQPKCSIVPIGHHFQIRSELLASARMKDFMMDLQAYLNKAYIIFDSKQMIDYADCKVLTPLVDQVVFVIQSGRTSQALAQDMIASLPKDKLAGVVINQELW